MDDYYSILQVSRTSTQNEIKKSYQNLAKRFHPDRVKSLNDGVDFRLINEAWEILQDPELRNQYDARLTLQKVQPSIWMEVDLDEMKENYNQEKNQHFFTWDCRCSGQYEITEDSMENGIEMVQCSSCSSSIRVLYQVENEIQ